MKFVFGKPINEPFNKKEEIKTAQEVMKRKQLAAVVRVIRIGKTSVILKTLKTVNIPKVYISAENFVEGKSFGLRSFLSYFSSLLITEVLNYTSPKRSIPKVIKYKGKELTSYIKLFLNINLGEIEAFFEKSNESIPEILDFPQRLSEEFKVNSVIAKYVRGILWYLTFSYALKTPLVISVSIRLYTKKLKGWEAFEAAVVRFIVALALWFVKPLYVSISIYIVPLIISLIGIAIGSAKGGRRMDLDLIETLILYIGIFGAFAFTLVLLIWHLIDWARDSKSSMQATKGGEIL